MTPPTLTRRAALNPSALCVDVLAARRLGIIGAKGSAVVVEAGAELTVTRGEVAERPSCFRSLDAGPPPKCEPPRDEVREVRMHLSAAGVNGLPLDGQLRTLPTREALPLVTTYRAAFADSWDEAAVRLAPSDTHDGPLETVRLLRPAALHFTRRTHDAGEETALPPEDARWLIGRGEAEPLDTPRRVLEAALAEALAEARAATPERRATLAQRLAALFGPP
jgi:hypothetical protein